MGVVALLAFRGLRIGVFLRHHIQRLVWRLQAGFAWGHPLCSGLRLFLPVADPFILFRFETAAASNHLRGVRANNGLSNSLPKEHDRITQADAR